MKFYIVIFMLIFPGSLQGDDSKCFIDAVKECKNRGLELLTMSTYHQYLDAQNYFNTHSGSDDIWLALERNTTIDNYQWLNGRVLTELKWKSGEPVDHTGTDCGVMELSSNQWYSKPCTDSRHYLCVGSDGRYSVGRKRVDFNTAVLNCKSEGRRLPVAITNLDANWLNSVINTETMPGDFWLGLIRSGTRYGDYFKWVTGEDLTPPYQWADNGRHSRVHYHHSGNDKGFHSDSAEKKRVLCISKSTKTVDVVRSPDKFVFVSNNAIVQGSPRKNTTINSLRRFQCALECLQDTDCIQYTIQGYLCETFGGVSFINHFSRGQKLWQRKIISSREFYRFQYMKFD